MADIVFIAVMLAFFAICVAYVRGSRPPGAELRGGRGRDRGAVVTVDFVVDNWVGLVIAVLLIGYLVAALLFPEKF